MFEGISSSVNFLKSLKSLTFFGYILQRHLQLKVLYGTAIYTFETVRG